MQLIAPKINFFYCERERSFVDRNHGFENFENNLSLEMFE